MTHPSSPLRWQDLPGAPATGTDLGRLDDIADGAARLLDLQGPNGVFRLILLRSGQEIFAYANRCAHFGVPLANKVEHLQVKPHESIRCCVHYARYRWQDGLCTAGDCVGETLIRVPVVHSADGRLSTGGD